MEKSKKILSGNEEYDWIIYTDGSAQDSNTSGGAGMVVTTGPMDQPLVILNERRAAGKWCSSYQCELVAIKMALEWLESENDDWTKSRIVTDSQSALIALSRPQYNSVNNILQEINTILANINQINKSITLTWVPSHCGVIGNELADAQAVEACGMNQEGIGWLFDVAKARCKAAQEKMTLTNERCKKVYGGKIVRGWEKEVTRGVASSFRRFRMGHSLELMAYQVRIGLSETGNCRLCNEDLETTEHVTTDCPALGMERLEYGVFNMVDLAQNVKGALKLWTSFKEKVATINQQQHM